MHFILYLTCLGTSFSLVVGEPWPYSRYNPHGHRGKAPHGSLPEPPSELPDAPSELPDLFVDWFRNLVNRNDSYRLQSIFKNGTIPDEVKSLSELVDHMDIPDSSIPPVLGPQLPVRGPAYDPHSEADDLFNNLGYALDPRCTINKSYWWYRTYEGNCNWLKQYETGEGSVGTAKQRDYLQYTYADGIAQPRDGPNPRAVSTAFFKRKKKLYYEHTPLLLGMIEFIMHDITYSQDSSDYIEVPMPEDEESFPLNTTLRVYRTAAVPGTGTSQSNPRENINMASTWLDISSLYGSTPDVANLLRSHQDGKLLTQEVQAPGTKSKASYLPFNTMHVPTNTRPGVDDESLFGGGDPRTNEDWLMLGVHTLLLREHNRLCDILVKQKPDWDDEQIYQTVRLLMSAKYALIANSYQMAYWTDEMPWPRDDGFPLYREMFGQSALEINPANTYPWPLVTKNGKPMTVSAEMAVVYRFHEFIIPSFPIKGEENNETLWEQDLFSTGFNATGFLDVGLERILRGTVASTIPNFKSGVDESFRTAGKYRGSPLDIVVASIVHEREQGLPTFNQYFRAYNEQNPFVEVPIRDRWEDFSTDPEMVDNLKRLYEHPDDVDLVVGCQLDEEFFPGTTVPKTALIISLFSLFGMGNSDRFSIGFAMMRCFLVNLPWDCHPSNALEDLLWEPIELDSFPNARFYNEFWLTELDVQAHGVNLLWRLITENSEIDCVQQYPLFPYDEKTNPILCATPSPEPDIWELILTAIQIVLKLIKQNPLLFIFTVLIGILIIILIWSSLPIPDAPPSLRGLPIIGEALAFQDNALEVLQRGFQEFGGSASRCFGIKLASLTHYVLTNKQDLEFMKKDNPYEAKFNLHQFLGALNFSIITKEENFESDLHTKLIRENFGNAETLAQFASVIEESSQEFLQRKPLTTGSPSKYDSLNDWINEYITFVVSRCIVGPEGYDNPELIATFLKFNDDAVAAMGLSALLPSFLQFLAAKSINEDFETVRKATLPIIEKRRQNLTNSEDGPVFLDYILKTVEDNNRASDLIAIVVWGGLVNLQATFSSTLLDIINDPNGQSTLLPTLKPANASNLDTFRPWEEASPWNQLRSAMFESIRLSGPVTGPARMVVDTVSIPSQPSFKLPKGSAATLSAYSTHRDETAWGAKAAVYQPERFLTNAPPIGEPEFITWGLAGPHMCPGRWFGQATILLMTKTALERYKFEPAKRLSDDEKYTYSSGNVLRVPVEMTVTLRSKT